MSQVEGDDGRVLENFIDVAGRLLSIPVQRKKRLAVLRWMAEDFQPGRLYPEEEVNRIISRRHPDFAALRRYLVDEELMQRRRGVYWRTGSVANVRQVIRVSDLSSGSRTPMPINYAGVALSAPTQVPVGELDVQLRVEVDFAIV